VLIIRRIELYQYNIWYISLCIGDCLVCRSRRTYWLRLFSSQTFSHIIPQNFSNPVHSTHTYPPMKMEQTERSETSAYKIQTPENYPEESIQQHVFCMLLIHISLSTTQSNECCHASAKVSSFSIVKLHTLLPSI
jgi:hypothetical protein